MQYFDDLWSDYRIIQIIEKRVLPQLGKITAAKMSWFQMCTLYLNMYEWIVTLKVENIRSTLESI